MTIGLSSVGPSGFLEVEASSTDSLDTGGFSSAITTGAITAQYSGTGTIQAPSGGLRVGTTQIKLVAGVGFLPQLALGAAGSDWSSGANIVDGDLNTFSGTLNSVVLPTVMEVVVDYGSIASRSIGAKFNVSQLANLATNLFTRMTSRIFVSDTETFGAELSNQVNNVQGTNTGAQNADFFHNVSGPTSFRFVKFTMEQETTNVPTGQRIGGCFVYSVNEEIFTPTDAIVNIRASDTQNTADGTIIEASINVSEGSTVTVDPQLLFVESQKYLTLDYATPGANTFNINLSVITSITEV